MSMPTIRKARALAKELGIDGVLIVGLHKGWVGAASYGSTKRQRAQLGEALDGVVELMELGVWALSEFNSPDSPAPTEGGR